MSTTTEKPPIEPAKPEHHDEFTGAFGFFRKYQKLILYSAGIFALITFSITGAMTSWLRGLTDGPTGPQPRISVMGREVEIEVEDQQIGGQIARHRLALPPTVLPQFMAEGESSDLATRLAILRRVAIATGLEVSMTEVDAAIDWMVRSVNSRNKTSDTATQAALQRGLNSLAEYRTLVKEAMRIGNFMMLNSIGVDTGDAAVMRKLLDSDNAEKIALRVATFDMKALEQQLKAKGDVTDDDIRKWMESKTDAEKARLEVFDTNRVALVLGIARFKDFAADEWPDELAAFNFGEEQQKQLYKQETERFKDDKGKVKPMDDAEVAAQLKTLAQVNEVLTKLLAKIRTAQQEVITPLIATQQQNSIERSESMQVRDAAKAASEAAPEDQELKTRLSDAELVLATKESALKASTEAIESARKSFDFRGKFAELTKDKKGFEIREVGVPRQPDQPDAPFDLKNAKALKDLSAVSLGEWKLPELATGLRTVGEFCSMPARAQDGAFLLQVTDVEVRPMRPWEELKGNLETKYFEEQAKKTGDEQKKILEDELLRMAKEKLPEQMAEIEAKRAPELSRLFDEWEAKQIGELAKANEKLASLGAGTQAQKAWQAKKDAIEAELLGRDGKRTALEKEVNDRFDGEVKTAAKKKYGEVLDAAAQAAGFTVTSIDPLRRDLRNQPLFDKRYDRTVVFLWGGIANDLKVGECTALTEDTVERRWQIATCDAVAPMTQADITRREFELQKRNFGLLQVVTALRQSYSLEALRKRYQFMEAEGRQIADNRSDPK